VVLLQVGHFILVLDRWMIREEIRAREGGREGGTKRTWPSYVTDTATKSFVLWRCHSILLLLILPQKQEGGESAHTHREIGRGR